MNNQDGVNSLLEALKHVNPMTDINALRELIFHSNAMDDRKIPFEKLMQQLSDLPTGISNHFSSEIINRFWNDLEHPPRHWLAAPFRSADGSNNSHIYPHMGKSNTSYAQSVIRNYQQSELPDPEKLFDQLMKRTSKFEPHPNKINSLLFGLGGFISHDLFHSDPVNPAINKSTHYADLSPLYGVNQQEQKKVRTFENGFLKPDTFADRRLQFQLPTISVIVILFSRNHNYIAKQLLEENENHRFTNIDGVNSPQYTDAQKDEMIFQTARLINCACYANLIVHQYLKTILGIDMKKIFTLNPLITPPAQNPTNGNVISAEFSYVYRWHSALSQGNVRWLQESNILSRYSALRAAMENAGIRTADDGANYERMTPVEQDQYRQNMIVQHEQEYMNVIETLLEPFGYTPDEFSRGPIIMGLHRNLQNAFDDNNITEIIREAMRDVASTMGARKVPIEMKDVDVQGIRSARRIGLCTLNEFRKFLRLKEYKSYEEMLSGPGITPDNDVIECLKELYGDDGIDKVELYPGLVIEATKTDGISLPYTMSRAIVSDAANLLRNDRFYNDGLNPYDLTTWGYQYANCDASNEPMFGKIVSNCLEGWQQNDPLLESPFRI
jgi:hypothetical protein